MQYRKTSGTAVSFIWGYNKMYPIAKIEHLEYDSISTSMINSLVNATNLDNDRTVDVINPNGSRSYQGNEGALRDLLDQLRQAHTDAMITTYTHDPLVGITSVTDSRGYTFYYHYDGFNRLTEVRDQANNLVTDYDYEYITATPQN